MNNKITAYLAPEGFEEELRHELTTKLGSRLERAHGRLFITRAARIDAAWTENVWENAAEIEVESISDAAKKLRALYPRWAPYSAGHHRRMTLIQEKLPKLKNPAQEFLGGLPKLKPASWTLLEPNLVLASTECVSAFPNGEVQFIEDHSSPPSRAYLKLWELFTVHGVRPAPGELCLDLGSSPGGWTWVLSELGARVISVDKAPLDASIARHKNVSYRQASAFAIDPQEMGSVDWLFSDIICAPDKLLRLVETWRRSGLARNFVCTIKFKGTTDHASAQAFASIPGSRLVHLHHNKHELTWVNLSR